MTLTNKVDQFITDADKIGQVANGDKDTVVQTGSGPVPSVSKLIADSQAAINTAVAAQVNLAPRLASPGGAAIVVTRDGPTVQEAVDTLASAVTALDQKKANASDLAAKANASDLAAKANASDLAAKANASDLAAKADKTALDAKADKSGATLTKPTIKGYIEQFQALNPGATVTLNPDNGTLIELTTTANTTVTLPAHAAGVSYTLIVSYGGVHTLNFIGTTSLRWERNSAPQATSVAGKMDKYLFTCGSSYTLGQDSGRNF